MGGFIKCTLRDKNGLTTRTLTTNIFNNFISDYKELFENDIKDKILESEVKKEYLTEQNHHQMNLLTPFDYGYIFIDRINKKVFLINNFDSISHFSNFEFKEEVYQQLKLQDYEVEISNSSNKKVKKIDIRKNYIMREFLEYKKLYSSIPYIKKIISIDEEVVKKESLEDILDELMILRKKRNTKNKNFVNDLVITEFKEWNLCERNKDKEGLQKLFEYLKKETILSDEEIIIWNKEIAEASS